ncbi:cuticle protein 7-like, partial [Palaemon carinicauda]|uniref:cuticle protein 7-like n=1 Tax=Palaemon carinicauda TaxID=392227 RepID=UPI0035B69493
KQIALLVSSALVVAKADRGHIYGSHPTYAPPLPRYHAPTSYREPEYPAVPPKYNFNYGVADGYSGANFAHQESRDGYKTQGSYRVHLPDGRIQTVTYYDNGGGLMAKVTYQGKAHYPKHTTPKYKTAPTYPVAPSYRPAFTYAVPRPPNY